MSTASSARPHSLIRVTLSLSGVSITGAEQEAGDRGSRDRYALERIS